MAFFFVVAYALAIFIVAALVALVPGFLLRLTLRAGAGVLVLPAIAVAVAFWIRFGWLSDAREASRIEVLVYATAGGLGLVRGWVAGIALARRRVRRSGAARRGRESRARARSRRGRAP